MAVVILRPRLNMVLLCTGRGQVGTKTVRSGKVDVKMETISGIFLSGRDVMGEQTRKRQLNALS